MTIDKTYCIIVILMVVVSCSQEEDLIKNNFELWEKSSIENYEIDYILYCFCKDDGILQTSSVEGGKAVSSSKMSIYKIFDLISNIEADKDLIHIKFNETFGYPTMIIVKSNSHIDADWTLKVTDLRISKTKKTNRN